jgi:hypothetical protein
MSSNGAPCGRASYVGKGPVPRWRAPGAVLPEGTRVSTKSTWSLLSMMCRPLAMRAASQGQTGVDMTAALASCACSLLIPRRPRFWRASSSIASVAGSACLAVYFKR